MKEASQVSWQDYGRRTRGTGIAHGLFYYWRDQNSSFAVPASQFTRRSGARTGTYPHQGRGESNPWASSSPGGQKQQDKKKLTQQNVCIHKIHMLVKNIKLQLNKGATKNPKEIKNQY